MSLFLLSLLSCNETGINAFGPAIHVQPTERDFGLVPLGESATEQFNVTNGGRGDLHILDLVSSQEGIWVPELAQWILGPGDGQVLEVTYLSETEALQDGSITLVSNDPDQEEVTLVLRAGTAPPEVIIESPAIGTVVDADPFEFQGWVSDEDDGPEALTIRWESDIDGLLHSAPADADGRTSFTSALSTGEHVVTLAATDPDGVAAWDSASVQVCPWLNPVAFEEPIQVDDWTLLGTAMRDEEGHLELTGLQEQAVGGAFRTSAPVSTEDLHVAIRFATGGGLGDGADGFSLTIAREDSPSLLGDAGGCLGYGEGDGCSPANGTAITGLHIEIDTYPNPWDPSPENHLAVTMDGDQKSYALADVIPDIEDDQWHTLRVRIQAPGIQIWLDEELRIDGEIEGFEDFTGFIGMTASTGDATNYHRIDDIEVDEGCPSR